MLTSKNIVEIFSYDMEEQEVFPYLKRYMFLIKDKLPEIERDNEKLRKFALAGLFLTYRAFNHSGQPMTTEFNYDPPDTIHNKKLIIFKEYFGETITDVEHYLSMINYTFFDFILMILRVKNISKKLYRFVIS
jgi:hypothetical protein